MSARMVFLIWLRDFGRFAKEGGGLGWFGLLCSLIFTLFFLLYFSSVVAFEWVREWVKNGWLYRFKRWLNNWNFFVQMAKIHWIDEVTKCKHEYVRGDVMLVKKVSRNFYTYTKLFNSLDVSFLLIPRYLIKSLKLSIHACVWKLRREEERSLWNFCIISTGRQKNIVK